MTKAINSSRDLADLLNTHPPATEADAAESPRDWAGLALFGGGAYPIDTSVSTDTLVVLADGHAAARRSGGGGGRWHPADVDAWDHHGARGVERDWRVVTVWDVNGYLDVTTHPTLQAAKAAFDAEVADVARVCRDLDADQPAEETL